MKAFILEVVLASIVLCQVHVLQAKDTCKNGGQSLTGNYTKCSCYHGYKGYDCGQKVSPCEGRPCRNNGKCTEYKNGTFSCKCPPLYVGVICERRVRPCDSNPCKNGGKCSDDGVKCFKCECRDGFKGPDCSEKILPCEISPCKHGGMCINQKNGDFKCACKNGYGGPLCERKDALFSSLILQRKADYVSQLTKWLDGESDWSLCYRASDHGWRANVFHARCDHRGPTVIIVRVGSYIFGGYTNVSWGAPNGYKRSTDAFLFSLRNKDGLKPFKSPLYRYPQYSTYSYPGYGPTFGGGYDFYIADNAYTSTSSYSNFGYVYRAPSGYAYGSSKVRNLLAGSYRFRPNEVEVFYLR